MSLFLDTGRTIKKLDELFKTILETNKQRYFKT